MQDVRKSARLTSLAWHSRPASAAGFCLELRTSVSCTTFAFWSLLRLLRKGHAEVAHSLHASFAAQRHCRHVGGDFLAWAQTHRRLKLGSRRNRVWMAW